MSKIHIDHKTSFSKDDIREKLGEVMGKIETKFKIKGNWSGDEYNFSRSGVGGKAVISDGKVVIDLKLGLVLKPFRKKIESEMVSRLKEGLP